MPVVDSRSPFGAGDKLRGNDSGLVRGVSWVILDYFPDTLGNTGRCSGIHNILLLGGAL